MMRFIFALVPMSLCFACADGEQPAPPPTSEASAAVAQPARPPAVRVEARRNLVCMVNDQLMGVEQIPVVVEGRTYYGCCPGCKVRLEQEAAIRKAADPISGVIVDKAKAVIGVRADGRVLYFENEQNLRRFSEGAQG